MAKDLNIWLNRIIDHYEIILNYLFNKKQLKILKANTEGYTAVKKITSNVEKTGFS